MPIISDVKRQEFEFLFQEFVSQYPSTKAGRDHAAAYEQLRRDAHRNYEEVCAAAEHGEDVTDQVLLKLLPYSNNAGNRQRGSWIHVAPAITGDLRGWFENAKWTSKEDWPAVAKAIYQFVRSCEADPSQLESACRQFSALPVSRGFQTGMLTPILNALRPADFALVNFKSRSLINYFADKDYPLSIVEYPTINRTLLQVWHELVSSLIISEFPQLSPGDTLDMFSHWLVSIKKYFKNLPVDSIDEHLGVPGLAYPFSEIFANEHETQIAFDLLAFASERLGVTGPEEPRAVISVREHGASLMIRLIYGNRAILSFTGQGGQFRSIQLALLVERVDFTPIVPWKFKFPPGQPEIGLYNFSPVEFSELRENILPVYTDTLVVIAQHFKPWHVSSYKKRHQEAISQAIFDPSLRPALLSGGVPVDKADEDEDDVADEVFGLVNPLCPFKPETFELLERLHQRPIKDFYMENREAFDRYVEKPFRRVMRTVAERLPQTIQDRMETHSNLFSKFLKNDFGQGGAWEYYWGAFYLKDCSRLNDAQLSLVIDHQSLEAGFYIGSGGDAIRKRLSENARRYGDQLLELLTSSLDGLSLVYGPRPDAFTAKEELLPGFENQSITLREWLQIPESFDCDASVYWPKDILLSFSEDDLVEKILAVHTRLYPFVLLAKLDEPLAEIFEYLEGQTELSNDREEYEPIYPLETFSAETGFDVETLQRWVRAVERKGQVILYGPPGTGKTFLAEKLARHLVGGTDGFYEIVQFHPAYAYEDFVQGIRPQTMSDGGLSYPLVSGRLLQFCDEARRRSGTCVLIIDEINRANLARVFGELMYLLEYRDKEVRLSGGQLFRLPKNVVLVGTMNTADRSIALVDHALRRRFAFLTLGPNMDVLRRYHQSHTTGFLIEPLVAELERLNKRIGDPHYAIGVSYFLREDLAGHLEDIWNMEIEPYLAEYFFDHPDWAVEFAWDKVKVRVQP